METTTLDYATTSRDADTLRSELECLEATLKDVLETAAEVNDLIRQINMFALEDITV